MNKAIASVGSALALAATALTAAPAHASGVPGTSVGIATVKFVPGSNSLSGAAQTALASSRWRAAAADALVITSYTRTSSDTSGALRAGRTRSMQRARKVFAQLNVAVPVSYRVYAAKSGARAKNAVSVSAVGFAATMSGCAAYTGVRVSRIRAVMGLAADGSQDSLAYVQMAVAAGSYLNPTPDLDLLCGGPGPDSVMNTYLNTHCSSPLQDPAGPGVDLFIGGGGLDYVDCMTGAAALLGAGGDTVDTAVDSYIDLGSGSTNNVVEASGATTIDGGPGVDAVQNLGTGSTFNGGGGADVAVLQGGTFNGGAGDDVTQRLDGGVFNGGLGNDLVMAYTAGCVTAVESVPEGTPTCL